MSVFITKNAEANLQLIYEYHAEYSVQYADKFHDDILAFVIKNLSEFPEMGIVHNAEQATRRLVFGNYNIYYLNQSSATYVLYIIDGRMNLNEQLQNGDVEMPELG